MGIYGAGKAFNLRYAHRQAIPQYNKPRQTQQQIFVGHQHCAPSQTTIDINYGPKGFWGFMSGFAGSGALGSLFNFIGGLFGKGNNLQASPYETLNQAQALQQPGQKSGMDDITKLKQMFPKHTFVPEGDGKYRARGEDGTIYGPATYEDMYKLLQQKPENHVANENDNEEKVKDGKGAIDDQTSELNGYSGNMTVHDEVRGSQYDINGKATISSETDKSSKFPKTITVKGNKYEYQRTQDGIPIYKSMDGAGDEYRLEKSQNGKFALNQYKGDKGAGTADISTPKPNSRAVRQGNDGSIETPKEEKPTIDQQYIKKNFDGSYSYSFAKVPYKPV